MTKHLTMMDDEGYEVEIPHRWEICGACRGEGQSSAYLGAYTQEDMDEAGPEFFEDYMAGHYGRACDECGGSGKVMVADYKRMTPDQRRAWEADQQALADMRAEEEAERRFGC